MAGKKLIKTVEDRRNNGFYTFNDTKTFLKTYKEKLKKDFRIFFPLMSIPLVLLIPLWVLLFFVPPVGPIISIVYIYEYKTNKVIKYYSTEKKRLKLLKKAKGKKSEEEYDRQVFAQIEQYNKPIIAENFYQSAFQKCSLTDLQSAAELGHEKAKQCLATYDAFIELTKVEDVDYGALISYAQNSEIGIFAAEYLKTFPISEKCSINDAAKLRDLGNFNAGKMLATIGDVKYKACKEAGIEDTEQLKYIRETLRSSIALIENAFTEYREAITEEFTKDERLAKFNSAYYSIQQGLKYVDEEHKYSAYVLFCLLKYEIWTPYSRLTKELELSALKNDLAFIRNRKKDEKAKAIFKFWGLNMESLCSDLISNYIRKIDAIEHPVVTYSPPTREENELKKIRETLEQTNYIGTGLGDLGEI